METAMVVALLCCGAVFGGLIVAAWMSDRTSDGLTDVLPANPANVPMPPVKPTKGPRPARDWWLQ